MHTAVFSYGSLIIPESASAAVQRTVKAEDLFDGVVLGARRIWGVHVPIAMNNLDGKEVDGVFFDLDTSPAHFTNGVLVSVTDEDLKSMSLREAQYDLVDVTSMTYSTVRFDRVLTFVGKEKFRAPRRGKKAIIPQHYEDRIVTAAKARGDHFHNQFQATTELSKIKRVGGLYTFLDPEQAVRV